MLLPHPVLSHNCSYYHQTTKNGQSRHNNRKHRTFITNLWTSSSPGGENSSQHSTILTTKLSTHQTKQSESFQETTIFTDVTSSKQDLKNPQLIIISHGFYVETSWHHSNNFRSLINATAVVYEVVYEAVYEAVSDAVSEVDASHLHELSRNSINLKWRLNYSLKIKTVKVKCPVLDFLIIILENYFEWYHSVSPRTDVWLLYSILQLSLLF